MLSGNRNFGGPDPPRRAHLNYLASPPLVVAYALAGTMDTDLSTDPIGGPTTSAPCPELWPTGTEVAETIRPPPSSSEEFRARYASVFDGDERWCRSR